MFGLKIRSHASKEFSAAVAAGHEARAREILIAEVPQLQDQFRIAQETVLWYADARDRMAISEHLTTVSEAVQRVRERYDDLRRAAERGDVPYPPAVLVPGEASKGWQFILQRLGGLDDHRERISPREAAAAVYKELCNGKS